MLNILETKHSMIKGIPHMTIHDQKQKFMTVQQL